ncbi:MAG: hypothetical protein EHM42_12580, partial [Planctomycetaceae bacterium]
NNVTINNIHNHQQVVNNNFNRRGGWGYFGGSGYATGFDMRYMPWHDYWYDRHINRHHHGWYHGAWGGNWTTVWVAPFAYGSWGWGSTSFLYSSGYVQYYNPYVTPVIVIEGVDYSRPIIVQQVVQVDGGSKVGSGAPADTTAIEPGLTEIDQARAAFRAGQYQQARGLTERALRLRPGDPAAHEFYALCLFALGEYRGASAVLNALLASAPGWDWTTMSSLYASPAEYERQLRALEAAAERDITDAPLQFVLAYHYLVCGHGEQAIPVLARVVELQPKDAVAKKLLATLESAKLVPPQVDQPSEEERLAQGQLSLPDQSSKPQPQPPEETLAEEPAPAEVSAEAPKDKTPAEEPGEDEIFDLVGEWVAELPQGGKITLTISEESRFTWRFEPTKGEVKNIEGSLNTSNDLLILESPSEGAMIGRTEVTGGAEFRFVLQGGPPDDPGLTFRKLLESE